MPLKSGKKMVRGGKPRKQAVAIALDKARRKPKKIKY